MYLALFKKVSIFCQLPFREQVWIFFLFPFSALVRLSVLIIPFKLIAFFLGKQNENCDKYTTNECKQVLAFRIGVTIRMVAQYAPWRVKCLEQAVLAKVILSLYRIPGIVYLGVCLTEDSAEPLIAHAWLKVGKSIIVGGEGYERFRVISTFSPRLQVSKKHRL